MTAIEIRNTQNAVLASFKRVEVKDIKQEYDTGVSVEKTINGTPVFSSSYFTHRISYSISLETSNSGAVNVLKSRNGVLTRYRIIWPDGYEISMEGKHNIKSLTRNYSDNVWSVELEVWPGA